MCSGSLCKVSKVLAAVGAINWGLVGAMNVNLVSMLVGSVPMVERVVYILVGLSGLMVLVGLAKCCKKGSCSSGSGSCGTPPMGGGASM